MHDFRKYDDMFFDSYLKLSEVNWNDILRGYDVDIDYDNFKDNLNEL